MEGHQRRFTAIPFPGMNCRKLGQDPNLPNYSYPVTTRHRIYLQLSSPLQEGATYTVSNPSYGSMNFDFQCAHRLLRIDQSELPGRLQQAKHVPLRNFGVYMGDGGSIQFSPLPTYKVYNESTGAILTNGRSLFS